MATIKDVAKVAGVAPSTVSYALSGKRPISGQVKERIQRAIYELDFRPNALAHNLRRGSNHSIAMVHPPSEIMLEGTSIDFVTSAAETLKASHTLSLISPEQSAESLLNAFRERRIDGLILMHIARHDARVEALRATDYPFVLIGRPENTQALTLVDFDFEGAAYLAIQHLVELGHQVIGYLDLPAKELSHDLGYAFYMHKGFARAEKDFGIRLFKEASGRRNSDSYRATQALIQRERQLTAIVALLGATHLGVLRAIYDNHKRVPEDYSLVFLGSSAAAQWTIPSLTTLDNHLAELGKLAAELVLQRLNGSTESRQIVLPAQLSIRESTARVS